MLALRYSFSTWMEKSEREMVLQSAANTFNDRNKEMSLIFRRYQLLLKDRRLVYGMMNFLFPLTGSMNIYVISRLS